VRSTQYCSTPRPKRCGMSPTIPRPAQLHTCTCGCSTSGGVWLGWVVGGPEEQTRRERLHAQTCWT
jgi:hypothetical protein